MTQSISGLGTGLDTNAIIQQLVALERRSVDLVKSRATKAQTALTSYSAIRSTISGLKSASAALMRTTDWRPLTATSSHADVASVTAGSGTFGGTITFTVGQLAAAGSIRSTNTFAGTATLVNADSAIMAAAGGAKIGFSTFASDNALAIGSHDIVVTQSSAAAVKNGTGALAASTVIDGTNNTLNITLNGAAKVLTIASGTYDRSQLAAAVQAAANTASAAMSVTVDSATNMLKMTSTREGSAASLQVTGGNALTPLQLSTDASARLGTDGKTKVGSAAEQTWTSIESGGTAVLTATAGTVTAVFSGGLRAGTVTAKNVSVGDGSLATVVANLNAAQAGVTATAVQVGDNSYRLQITSNTAGASNGANVATSEFNAAVGGFVTLTAAADASLTVGSGPGAYTVTSASNTVSNLLPGVTVTLKSVSATPVTITANRDVSALAAKVQALVDAANKVKGAIDVATAYDKNTKKAAPLAGDSVTRRILSELNRALGDAVPWAAPGSPGLAGLSVDKTGKYTFDSAKFTSAFNADPEGMTKLFVQGGSATNGTVSFVSAGDRARAGTYAVAITTAAAQASDVGLEGAWPIGSPPTVRVKVGTKEVSYAIKVTDTQTQAAAGLNAAFASGGLALQASVSGTGLKITSNDYGTSATFQVAWDGSTWETYTGVNVAGTINGVTGTGSGQNLSIAFDNNTLGGLTLAIASTTTGALGTFTYQPGVAQRASTSLLDATDAVTGYLTSSENSLKSRVTFIEKQVTSMEVRLVAFEARLRRQFATLEATLGQLQAQSNWLAGQVGSLNQQQSG
ncbi:MAG: flagellar filament capping protein FliD [Actinomycetota bacterium]